jgi:ribosome-binding factor A
MASRNEFSRSDRVRKALIREVSDIIANEVKNPALRNEIISITDIELSKDLSHAKIYISVFGDPERQAAILEILQEEKPKIRSLVGQRIRLRHTPDLAFYLDNSLERGVRISQLLNQIASEEA